MLRAAADTGHAVGTMPLPVGFALPHHDAVGEAHFGAAATAIAGRGGVKGAAFNEKAIEETVDNAAF